MLLRYYVEERFPRIGSYSAIQTLTDWLDTFFAIPQRIRHRINVFVYWAPILWEDYDFDHTYLYIVMLHKIKAIRKHFLDCEYHSKHSKEAKNMSVAITALERLVEDKYKQDEIHALYVPGEDKELGNGLIELGGKFEPHAEFVRLCEQEEKLKEQDLKLFAKMFVKYSRGWWC